MMIGSVGIIYYKKQSCILHVHFDIDYISICRRMETQSKLDTVDQKYQRTLVYRIMTTKPYGGPPQVFVGATHLTLEERIAEHRWQRVGLAWKILQDPPFHITKLFYYPCNTLREVLALSRDMRERNSKNMIIA